MEEYPNRIYAEQATGIAAKNIWAAIRGKSKTAGGFQWIYKNDSGAPEILVKNI